MSSDEDTNPRFAAILDAMLSRPGVSHGHGKRGFGSNALNVHGKIFCMQTPGREFVVKVSAARAKELIESGLGTSFRMAGRPMREWVVCRPEYGTEWKALALEAYLFVGGKDGSTAGK